MHFFTTLGSADVFLSLQLVRLNRLASTAVAHSLGAILVRTRLLPIKTYIVLGVISTVVGVTIIRTPNSTVICQL